jgi:hypothetical protein
LCCGSICWHSFIIYKPAMDKKLLNVGINIDNCLATASLAIMLWDRGGPLCRSKTGQPPFN